MTGSVSSSPRLARALARATADLLAARAPSGHWVGELSASALSTATAVTALAIFQRESKLESSAPHLSPLSSQIRAGLDWLAAHANPDGGWGDTVRSLSNLSTTALVWAAFGVVPDAGPNYFSVIANAEHWLIQHAGSLAPDQLAPAIIRRYGRDRTFSVPILTMCALAGRLGQGRAAWQHVIPLPFELAACPHRWFAALRLPVVSYALPALIAIGQARHVHAPSRNPLARAVRSLTRGRTLDVLIGLQPRNGGFLEATPLTSFVVMSLAGSGQVEHPVTERGADFLRAAQRPDGSWPIDTNLATWLTTLAVNAVGKTELCRPEVAMPIRDWLLRQQYRVEHPYTHAAPGGWAWTDLPGGVPDADDTAGALLTLAKLGESETESHSSEVRVAAEAGVNWLLNLQNRDGGVPTFCRGWGALPFDRSSADITAHAIRAWRAWQARMPGVLRPRLNAAIARAMQFLRRSQRRDGAWVPLWFGNQFAPDDENPTYGTTRVMLALAESGDAPAELLQAVRWLVAAQSPKGNWGGCPGGPASVEETALAVEALAAVMAARFDAEAGAFVQKALWRGAEWLAEKIEDGGWTCPSPIGFYFARLWYFEKLYPLIFATAALRRAVSVATHAQD